MADEKKDQAPQEQSKQQSFSDRFDEGWNKHEEEMQVASEAKPKPATQPATQKTFKRKPCAECPEEDAVPYRVLKVDGQEIPVWTEEELIAKAQMGDSYTRKTQKLSEDRKVAEKEYQSKVSDIEKFLQNFNQMFDEKMKASGKDAEQPAVKRQEQRELRTAIYDEFDIDEQYAEPYQKKFVDTIVDLRNKLKTQEDSIKDLGEFVKFQKIERGMARLATHINAAREKFPIEVYKDDEGNNLTAKQLVEIINEKANQPDNRERDLGEIAEEAVREVHQMQKKIQESVPVTNNMTADQFKAKYPELYENIVKSASQAAVTKHEAEKAELPPSIPRKEATIDIDELKKAKREVSGKSLHDTLEEAFEDPEIIAGLGLSK